MEKAYERQYFANDTAPELNGDNMNRIDRAVDMIDDRIIEMHINVSSVIEEEKARVKNETKRQQNEAVRQAQENRRQQEEQIRQAQENRRQQEEQIRQAQEERRQQDEEARKTEEERRSWNDGIWRSEENKRQQNEAVRQAQEEQRQQEEAIRQTQEEQRQQDTARAVESAEDATEAAVEVVNNLYKGIPKLQINFEDGCLYYCGTTKFMFLINRETGSLEWGLTA